MDSHKTTMLYFIVNALDILNELSPEIKQISINFILNNAIKQKDLSTNIRKLIRKK